MWAQRLMWILWPAFLAAGVLEMLVFVLVDGEIGPTKLDTQMLEWLRASGVPHTVVATKIDKVRPSKLATRKKELAQACALEQGDIMWISATKGTGIEQLQTHVNSLLTPR